jgi:hypothetical protein
VHREEGRGGREGGEVEKGKGRRTAHTVSNWKKRREEMILTTTVER